MTEPQSLRTEPGDPVVDRLEATCFTVPTEVPEADGTIAWNATTLVLVTRDLR